MTMTSLLKSSMNGLLGSSSDAASEGARRAAGEMASEEAPRRDPEVVANARRRQFSGSEKRRLLAEAERCKVAGTLGAFLRRERIYSSMITSWRKQVGAADQTALAPKRRGPKPDLMYRRRRDASSHRHRAFAPVGGVRRLLVERQVHHLIDFPRRQRLAPGRTGRVLQQPVHSLGGVAPPPAAHGEHALAHSRRHLDRPHPLAGQEHDLRPPYDLLRCVTISHQSR